MTDKVKKIREEVVGIINSINLFAPDEDGKNSSYEEGRLVVASQILQIIDSLQEEPVSKVWYDAGEKPERENLLIETNDGRIIHRQTINNYGMVKRWAYTSDLLNLDNSCNFGKKLQKEPVSNPIDFEQELYKAFGQVKDFTLGMRIAKWFYDMGKNSKEPVGEKLAIAARRASVDKPDTPIEFLLERPYSPIEEQKFIEGAKWHKEEIMAKAIEVKVHIDAGGYPYTPEIELYDYDKDVPLAKDGDKYKVVLIKEN